MLVILPKSWQDFRAGHHSDAARDCGDILFNATQTQDIEGTAFWILSIWLFVTARREALNQKKAEGSEKDLEKQKSLGNPASDCR